MRLPQIFICFQLLFHFLDSLQLTLALDNTKSVIFCTNHEVNFEYLGYITFWDTFDGSATARSFNLHRNSIEFNGEKVANELSGCTDNSHQLDLIKKANPMTRFVPNFSDDPRCAPIKSYRGRALVLNEFFK